MMHQMGTQVCIFCDVKCCFWVPFCCIKIHVLKCVYCNELISIYTIYSIKKGEIVYYTFQRFNLVNIDLYFDGDMMKICLLG